ncbi:hypothetical protein H8D57_03235 [bacterium]|nr:hypothetical protein [bacterium]
MILIGIEPSRLPAPEHLNEYDELRQSILALAQMREEHKIHFYDLRSLESNRPITEAIIRDLRSKFSEDETIKQIDEEMEKKIGRMNEISISPIASLKIPTVGKDPIADKYFEEKYLEMRRSVKSLSENLRKTWDRPYEKVYSEFTGTLILELVSDPEAILLNVDDSDLVFEARLVSLKLNKIITIFPELEEIFGFNRKGMLLEDEIMKLKAIILNDYADKEIALKIVNYLDYWLSRGHDFLVVSER